MSRAHKACFLTFLALGGVIACKVFDSQLLTDGSADVPVRPPDETSSPADGVEVVFALKDIFIRQQAQTATQFGLDLDHVRTTDDPKTQSCNPTPGSGQIVPDGDHGIDNALGRHVLPLLPIGLPCIEDNIALTQGRGKGTVLLWLRRWNGLPNDASVSVVLTTSVDGTSEDPALLNFQNSVDQTELAYMAADGGFAPPPGWEGNDTWYFDKADFGETVPPDGGAPLPDINKPIVEHTAAYVALGRLVVPLVEATHIRLLTGEGNLPSDGNLDVIVNGGIILGDINSVTGAIDRGMLAGRFRVDDLRTASETVGNCENADIFAQSFAQFADIAETTTLDNLGERCRAFSIGVPFTAVPGLRGGIPLSSLPQLSPCAGETPEADTCCPSAGNVCTTPEQMAKFPLFSELPPAVQVPVPMPTGF